MFACTLPRPTIGSPHGSAARRAAAVAAYPAVFPRPASVVVDACVSRGQHFFFVSHAWQRPMVEMIHMLQRHFSVHQQKAWRRGADPLIAGQVYVWIDAFAFNKHTGKDLEQLKDVLGDAQETLLIVDPTGTSLTRAWCLYEAWQSCRIGKNRLLLLSYGVDFELIKQVFIDIDLNTAQTTRQADLKRMLADIGAERGTGGVRSATSQLKKAIVASVVRLAPWEGHASLTLGDAVALDKAALVCMLYGRFDEAKPLASRAWGLREELTGPEDEGTLGSRNLLSLVLTKTGRGEAEHFCRETLEIEERVLGEDHPGTLTMVHSLRYIQHCTGHLDDAEDLYRTALRGRNKVLGPDHPDTLATLTNLATLLYERGKLEEAEVIFALAMNAEERVLGPDHPQTITCINSLAAVLHKQGRSAVAEALVRRAVESAERVHGPDDPRTLLGKANLAGLLYSQGKTAEAEEHYTQVLELEVKLYGRRHRDTIADAHTLADILRSQGRTQEASAVLHRLHGGARKA
ncbi:hypothetical protein FOA52_014139 [Chlamydomonas sp. UWO 241]|nr:hypothetical protein FOA52_014139 [Chlamydomonas sp. UWO 241]